MKKQIILVASALLLASSVHALTTEEQVMTNTIEIGFNSEAVTSLEERVNKLEAIVVRLESFHNIRQFTINEIHTSDDISVDSFKNQLATLNYQSGEFLYVEFTGSGTTKFCTSNSKAVNWLDSYITQSQSYTWWENDPTDTWGIMKDQSTWAPTSEVFAGTGISTSYSTFNLIQTRREYNSTYPYEHTYSDNLWINPALIENETEIQANGYGDSIITFKAASTRLEACGF